MTDHALNVALYLEAQGLGSTTATSGWLIRVGRMDPQYSGPQLVVRDTGGLPQDLHLGGGKGLERPTVQVRVRGAPNDYAGTRQQIESVVNALHGLINTSMNGALYQAVEALQQPIWLGYTEPDGRPEWTVNFRLWK